MRRGGPAFEEVASFGALRRAARRASKGLRHRPAVAAFLADIEPEVLALQRELLGGRYHPRPMFTFPIRDPKPRMISAAAFRDRVVHHALCDALEPRFERYADPDSYACRVGKGNLAAIRRVQQLARRHPWYVKLDVRHYFETVDHEVLHALLGRLVRNRRVLDLMRIILEAGAHSPGRGLPIGNLTSQHFGNLYLGLLDHHLREELRAPGMTRYMDDIVIFGPDRCAVRYLRDAATRFINDDLCMEVKSEVTALGPVTNGVPFLGFRIWPGLLRLDGARVRRFRAHARGIERALQQGILDEEAASLLVSSLFAWASQADTWALRRSFWCGVSGPAV